MTTKQGLRRLADAVKARRTELGLAQGDLAGRGGPSVVVVGQIERMQQANPQSLTLARLDRALAWETGSAAAVLVGGKPQGAAREGQSGLRVVEDEGEGYNAVLTAIHDDPYLLPEAKQHLRRQYELLLRVQPVERLPYAAHGRRSTEVDPDEEARIEAAVRRAVEARRKAPRGGRSV